MESVLRTKSYEFALNIVNLVLKLQTKNNEYVLSKQLLRSGTAVGALIREAKHAESVTDFKHKMNIALKEAEESLYWLDLLKDARIINLKTYEENYQICNELVSMLISTIKTLKKRIN